MEKTGVGLNLGGALEYRRFTVPYTDLTDTAGTSKAVTLFTIPKGGKILGVFAKHSVAFAGVAISAMTVSVGKSGSTTFFTSAFDIFAAVADTTVQETALFKCGQLTALAVIATFTSTGANLTVLTAGSVDIYVLFANVTTPL